MLKKLLNILFFDSTNGRSSDALHLSNKVKLLSLSLIVSSTVSFWISFKSFVLKLVKNSSNPMYFSIKKNNKIKGLFLII